jgi:L-rhamnose isomerase/sugar isomerase
VDIREIEGKVAAFTVALPSWGAGRGGTRFAKFPFAGAPTNVHEKLEDCAVVQQLCRITPRVSPHFPWDHTSDYPALRQQAESLGVGFDAVNSNTFQDQEGQKHSYARGSLTATDRAVREQAIEHNVECIRIGRILGSKAITVWIGDGSNFPGQQDLTRAFDRYLESTARIYSALPDGWRMLLEHKLFEPAFYSTVLQDWGSSILAAQQLGPRTQCLVDLGHHAPTTNIEQIVARLHRFGKLGGFHFNDSKYGDDDLDSGAINPHQLFLVFNELVEAERNPRAGFDPAYMIDQSHNVTDPIESMLSSAEAIASAYAKALVVDRVALHDAQESNDVMMAFQALRQGYRTDVSPVVAHARMRSGGAIDAIATYRASGWREGTARKRRLLGPGTGIV